MKKFNLICSAIAAFGMLALAGCDLTIPESKKCEYATADYEVETLPYLLEGVVQKDSVLEPLNGVKKSDGTTWSTSDGVSISFYLSSYTSDWSMIFQVPSSNWGTTTAHYCEDKIWQANAYGNQDGNGTWDQFNNNDCFITISMDYTHSNMTYYKNGEAVTVYGKEDSEGNALTKGGFKDHDAAFDTDTWVQNILDDISEYGIYCIHPTDSWANASAGDYKMKYFVVDVAVDADGAEAKYEAYKAYVGE